MLPKQGTYQRNENRRLDLTLSAPNFRRHLSSALKISLGKKFICKVERLNV